MSRAQFRLFVAGDSVRSTRAIRHLRDLCGERLGDTFELEIVDVLEEPERAESEGILATPTLIKVAPAPVRRVTGDLTDRARLMAALALDNDDHNSTPTKETR